VIPLAKDTVWAKALDLNAAIRGTDYSTSGYVTTWKVGATWDVIDDLRLRATRSRDIRAPNLTELFSLGGGGPAGYINPFRGGVSETFGYTSNQGNTALVPETSDYTGVGAVLHPVFFPGFSASVDYWNMSIDKAIGSLTVQQIIDQCYTGNTQLCSALTFGTGNTITKILQEPFNLVSQVVRGLDIEASYRTSLDNIVSDWNGNITARFLATNFLKFRSSNGINTPLETAGVNADITNAVPDWRWNADLVYSNETVMVDFGARGVSGGVYNTANIECTSGCPVSTTDHRTVDNNHIDGAVFFDASFTYKFGVGDTATEAFPQHPQPHEQGPGRRGAGPRRIHLRSVARQRPAVRCVGPCIPGGCSV
jgi:iron complex outermembrane receptor protein